MELNKILHPDLLPEAELLHILESLSIRVPANLSKLELLEIYKKVALPLPQRNKETKQPCELPDISTEIDLRELSLSKISINEAGVLNYSKKMKISSQSEDKRNINEMMLQLEKDCEKMIVDVENAQVSKSVNRKVALKRSHLLRKVCTSQEGMHAAKKIKYIEQY